jgi:hypothetical protein
MARYLKSRKDGWIFEWDPILANNPVCYEVTEEEAYPERFIPVQQVEEVKKTRAKRKSNLDLGLEDFSIDVPNPTSPELAADAARGWPK